VLPRTRGGGRSRLGSTIGPEAGPELPMSVLDNVLRLHRRECEDRRRYATDLELLAERLRADAGRLRREMVVSASNVSLNNGPLAERFLKLELSVAEIEGQLAAAHAALAAAQQQLKLYERAVIDRAGGQALSDRRLARRIRQSRPAAVRT
jgi:hypothetical protein